MLPLCSAAHWFPTAFPSPQGLRLCLTWCLPSLSPTHVAAECLFPERLPIVEISLAEPRAVEDRTPVEQFWTRTS